jgi:hypothetical protein
MRSLSPGREIPLRTSTKKAKEPEDSELSASALRYQSAISSRKGGRTTYSATLTRLVARLSTSLGLGCSSITNWMSNGAPLKRFASNETQYGF